MCYPLEILRIEAGNRSVEIGYLLVELEFDLKIMKGHLVGSM